MIDDDFGLDGECPTSAGADLVYAVCGLAAVAIILIVLWVLL